MMSYCIYGTPFATTISFRSPLPPTTDLPDLLVTTRPTPRPLDPAELLYVQPEESWNAAAVQRAYRRADEDVLVFPDGDQITVQAARLVYRHPPTRTPHPDFVDIRVLGSGFAWWLLRRGVLPFHAGAVVDDGGAVLFLAESGAGKSTLMCALLAEGVPLLCDDFVAVSAATDGPPVAASAYPQMRMWPATVERFIGSADAFPPVAAGGRKRRVPIGESWGRFLAGRYPVSRIYLLQREERAKTPITVERVEGHEAFMRLLTSILMGFGFPTADLQPVWPILQRVAAQIPLYHLIYPSGWQWLPLVRRVVMQPQP